MKWQSVLAGALASVFVTAFLAGTASADMRIVNDPGGEVSSYVLKFNKVRATGERVVIDGPCLSACTLLIGIVPAPSRLRHQTSRVGFPRRVLLRRCFALVGADSGRH
jgi:hypothetical protein